MQDYEFVGLPDIEIRMSDEQQDTYVVDQVALTVILNASILGSLIVSFVLFLIQSLVEGARMRREELAAAARRLRYAADGTVTEPAPLPEWAPYLRPLEQCPPNQVGPFHIFLSHNWGQGQDRKLISARTQDLFASSLSFRCSLSPLLTANPLFEL